MENEKDLELEDLLDVVTEDVAQSISEKFKDDDLYDEAFLKLIDDNSVLAEYLFHISEHYMSQGKKRTATAILNAGLLTYTLLDNQRYENGRKLTVVTKELTKTFNHKFICGELGYFLYFCKRLYAENREIVDTLSDRDLDIHDSYYARLGACLVYGLLYSQSHTDRLKELIEWPKGLDFKPTSKN